MSSESKQLSTVMTIVPLLAFFALAVCCVQGSEDGPGPSGRAVGLLPTAGEEIPPPDPPREFRRLTVAPISGAPELVSTLLKDPGSTTARHHLVGLYEDAAYLGAARFFGNTLRELEGKTLVTTPVRNPVAWSATGDLADRPLEVARRVNQLLSEARYTEAVLEAHRDIEEHGSTLQVAVQWAYAVIYTVLVSEEQGTPEALEVAIRIFLTSLEEKVPQPLGVHNKASGYDTLARFFFRLGDTISSRTAAKLALEHLAVTDTSPEWDKFAAQRLQELLREIEKSSSNPE